ncbi:MAG: hypothetical protein ABIF08_02575 [Nanoarchaeota archaeon]
MNCKKCPYFDTKQKMPIKVPQLVGYCKLREKFVDEMGLGKQFCKDKAVINISADFNKKG